MTPKLSIITPSYNQGRFLEETILSVLDQNYQNLEYIIIDGGSSDNTLEVIKRYEGDLAFWLSERDRGQSDAINKGFRRATGEIITWLNSDDVYLPHTLQHVAEYFDNPEVALIHGKTILYGNGIKEQIRGACEQDLEVQYLARIPFPQPSSFFRRQVLLEQGYLDESFYSMMDYDLLVRIALNYKLKRVEDIFSRYRLHEGCKTLSSQIGHAQAAARVFSKVLRSFDFTENFIRNMRELGLYVEGKDRYRVTKHYGEDTLRLAFLYFLEGQAHYYYSDLDLEKTRLLTGFIRHFDSIFYKSLNLDKLFWRSRFLHKSAVRFLRIFTR
jgi:glycosyltransferase involved in cell wall biosynthesis